MLERKWRAISLFAGAGGCSLGFTRAGVEILRAYELADAAIETYNANFGEGRCIKTDLANCDFERLRNAEHLVRGELDVLLGGPPCQGFTSAGNRQGTDPRNKLVQNYAQALNVFYPRWFMMENVEGILTTARGAYLVECIRRMIGLGYSVFLKKFYMQEYGIPQRRKRVFIVGNREGKDFRFPPPEEQATGAIYRSTSTTLRNAIGDIENVDDAAIDQLRKRETGIQLERIHALAVGQTMRDLPPRLQHRSFQRRAARRVCDGMPSEKRGGAPSGLKRLSYDEPCLTITSAATSEFVHPIQDRMLTIRECARIQTFPDSFRFHGTMGQKILQIGNAIPPKFAEIMAGQILASDQAAPWMFPPELVKLDVTKSSAQSPALDHTCRLLQSFMKASPAQMELEL